MKHSLVIVISILLLVASALAAPAIEDILKNELSRTLIKDSPTWHTWQDGVKEMFNLDLIDVQVSEISIIESQQNGDDTLVVARITIAALAQDLTKTKYIIVQSRVIGFLIRNGTILGSQILQVEEPIKRLKEISI